MRHVLVCLGSCLLATGLQVNGQQVKTPLVLDEAWTLQLVSAEPDLVTPISCRFDHLGRLLVVESNTHFRPEDYPGPMTDRIYVFDRFQTGEGTGRVQSRKRLFYEGGMATMGLAVLEDGWIAVATRSEVSRIRDSDGDDVADQQEVLLRLETEADYPHNGLAGIALGPDGLLYVGQGENLGVEYQLVAADGSRQAGGGEGGNIFRCTPDGKQLERFATGFWNPFGLYFDPHGQLWTVGNDPDARPPCRLLHVVPGGDYGFQFRFGRAGTNPLQSWNGELPGTLPMTSGTGEAPCAVVGYDDHLWVTSWGSNRVERYRLEPRGSSWSAKMEVVLQGDANFRPVDMAVAPDGSLYFTDWVNRSYPVHGKGRLWRLSHREQPAELSKGPALSIREPQTPAAGSGAPDSAAAAWNALKNATDPFEIQSAVYELGRSGELQHYDWAAADTPTRQLGLLMAWRWQELTRPDSISADQRSKWLAQGLQARSVDVQLAALRWATEREQRSLLPTIRRLLDHDTLSAELFACTVASIAYLETGSAARGERDQAREALLYEFASNSQKPVALRTLAVRLLPAEADAPTLAELGQWIVQERDRAFGAEIVRLLAAKASPAAFDNLAAIVADTRLSEQVRADALAGLAKNAGLYSATINQVARPGQPEALRREAQRMIRRGGTEQSEQRPQPHDVQGWEQLLADAGDVDAGRRVFFRTTCANCHAHAGRGSRVGPDLTNLAGQMTRARLLESILLPGREVGPLYVPWRVLTRSGQLLTGMRLEKTGASDKMVFLGAEGATFEVPLAEIEEVNPSPQSIMPEGLEANLTVEEFRDLVAFLLNSTL